MSDKLGTYAFFGRETKLEFMGVFSMIFEVSLLCTNGSAYNIVLKTYFCELQMVDYLVFF